MLSSRDRDRDPDPDSNIFYAFVIFDEFAFVYFVFVVIGLKFNLADWNISFISVTCVYDYNECILPTIKCCKFIWKFWKNAKTVKFAALNFDAT